MMKKQSISINGTVQAYLLKPEGQVDGLLQDLRKVNVFSSLQALRSNLVKTGIASLDCVSLAMTNHGCVSPVLLSDGKQLHLPPHLSAALQEAVKPSDAIEATVEPGKQFVGELERSE